ncbi:MAG TPA: hypothetical protein V6C57_00970 [Coleofasciculaceae cyanobacterium]
MRLSFVIRGIPLLNGVLVGAIASSALGLSALGLSVGSLLIGLSAEPAAAQALPTCQPPRSNQFLLLVLNQKAEAQNQLQQLLPANAVLTVCDYLSNNVVRVEGFSSAEIANAWAKYISDRTGLRAFVARSAAASIATTPALTSPTQANGSSSSSAVGGTSASAAGTSAARAYNPQPLGAGYAVLVNYFSKPEVANDVSQVTASAVGLAAYNQHPYLLAIHTTNETTATALLRTLSDRGFTAVIVDSRRVMLLAPNVAGAGGS